MMHNNGHKTHSRIHTRLKTSHARYHSFTPKIVDSLIHRERRNNIPKILGYEDIILSLKVASHKKGRNNIPKYYKI
jgi:hypothetical protein